MASYIITRADDEYLQHHGAKGMKWGVRRFQNEDGSLTSLGRERYGVGGERSAQKTAWDLNKLDREQTRAKANYDYYSETATRKIARANKKIAKAESKGKSEKIAKLQKKIEKINNTDAKKAEEWKHLLDQSKEMTDKIIKASLEKGYSIKSKDVLREVSRGKSAAAYSMGVIGGMAMASVTGYGAGVIVTGYAQGKHYSVKNDGLGTQTHQSRRFAAIPTVHINSAVRRRTKMNGDTIRLARKYY